MKQERIIAATLKREENSIKSWIMATRPKTLTVSFVPLLVGTAMAYHQEGSLNWLLVASLFFCLPWIQIGMNLINDALDIKKSDEKGKAITQQRRDLLSPRQFLFGGFTAFFLALILGTPLMIFGGWPFAALLFLSILLGYAYTGGPLPLSYTGTSESFILIFYGWVATGAAFYIQTGEISSACLLAGTQIGLLAIVPHAINNLRDRKDDALVQKRTLAVRFGSHFARWEITLCSVVPFFAGIGWLWEGNIGMAVLPLCVLPFVVQTLLAIWGSEPSPSYHAYIARSAQNQLLFGCLLSAGIFFA